MTYQEALDRVRVLKTQMYIDFIYRSATKGSMILLESEIDENLNIIQELVNEKLEQESRKEKLIVGSKWECVANCYCESYGDALKIEKGEITQLQSYHNHTLALNRGIMPTQQFLLCFKPLKEGE